MTPPPRHQISHFDRVLAFLHLPRFERWLLLPAWLLLGAARAAVRCLGFRRLAPWLGQSVAVPPPMPAPDERAQRRAVQIARTIRLASGHTPWQSNCLTQALAAHCFLCLFRVGHMVCFGVARSDATQLQAHSWVLAGDFCVTGGAGAKRFTRVACYVSRPGKAP